MTKFNSALAVENKGEDDTTALVTKALADLTKTVDDRLKPIEAKAANDAKLTARLDAIETKLNRPAILKGDNDNEPTLEAKAFRSFLRLGEQRMPAEEAKALIVADNTRGGYLTTPEFSKEVLKNLVEFSPVRQAARVGSTASGSVILPKRTGAPTANWVGETETRTSTESSYGQATISIYEMAAYVDVSLQLLEDAEINVESEVAYDLAEEFGRLEGATLLNGDGVGKPEGFMQAAAVDYVANGHATVLAADSLISLMYDLPAFYRNRGTWMLNGTSLATVRKLKDGQGNYLWQPSYQVGQPETLLGRPIVEAVDAPDIAADAYPIAFGDFNKAYRVYDRTQMSLLRDPYSLATTGKVRFHARRRVGGGTVMAEAIRKLKMAVS
jgi:HK97 family phage major capsid protein